MSQIVLLNYYEKLIFFADGSGNGRFYYGDDRKGFWMCTGLQRGDSCDLQFFFRGVKRIILAYLLYVLKLQVFTDNS